MKQFTLLALLLVSPALQVHAQQISNSADGVRQQLLGVFASKGFKDTAVGAINLNGHEIVISNIDAKSEYQHLHIGSIKMEDINPGYRWFRAKQLLISDIRFNVGDQEFSTAAILVNGLGILDLGSAKPSLAFDQLAMVDGQWIKSGKRLLAISEFTGTAKQWKDVYAIPATLNVKGKMTISGELLVALYPAISSAVAGISEDADFLGQLSSTTSSGVLSTQMQLDTANYGKHHIEAILNGFDDGLLSAYFDQGDENILKDKKKVEDLQKEFWRRFGQVSVQSILYHGENLQFVASIMHSLGLSGQQVASFVQGYVTANSSPEKAKSNVNDILPALQSFLENPQAFEIDVLPSRTETYAQFDQQLQTGGKFVDYLGVSTHIP